MITSVCTDHIEPLEVSSMPDDDEILIQAFRAKYEGAAKHIAVKRESLWCRDSNRTGELLIEVWITIDRHDDRRHVVIEKGTFDELMAIADRD